MAHDPAFFTVWLCVSLGFFVSWHFFDDINAFVDAALRWLSNRLLGIR